MTGGQAPQTDPTGSHMSNRLTQMEFGQKRGRPVWLAHTQKRKRFIMCSRWIVSSRYSILYDELYCRHLRKETACQNAWQ